MKNKLFFILLLFSLNIFSQEYKFKEKLTPLYFDEPESYKNGRFYSISKDGNLNVIIVGKKRKGVKQGEWFTFSELWGNPYLKKVENYKNGKLHGYYFETDYHTFSKEGYYKNGRMHGFWKINHFTISSDKGYYKNGKKHGFWEEVSFIEKGRGRYKNDLREGWWIFEDTDIDAIDKNENKKTPQTKIFYKKDIKIE